MLKYGSMPDFLDTAILIQTFGLLGIYAIVFAESGLFFGFFLPGDSLLFTAGLIASQGYFSIFALAIGTFVAAVLGDSIGYAFGYRVGPKIFTREESLFFSKKHLKRAETFYEEHGKFTIILARFVPVIRTFAPIVAGVGRMKYSVFLSYNIIGGFIWTIGLSYLGYILGETIPNIDRYLLPIVIFIIILSLLPILIQYLRERQKSASI